MNFNEMNTNLGISLVVHWVSNPTVVGSILLSSLRVMTLDMFFTNPLLALRFADLTQIKSAIKIKQLQLVLLFIIQFSKV